MRIGIFQLLPQAEGRSDEEVIEQALWEADFAEANGYDSVWIAEHHASRFGLIGTPSVYAAALAQRTKRIEIGYAVAVVPLHHPVRLAEEISWVQNLSRGRLAVGVGPGFSPFEFGTYGIPLEERHSRLEEGSRIVRGLLENIEYSCEGSFHSLPPRTLRPRPYGGRAPCFYRASSSEDSVRAAAREGTPLLLGLKSIEALSNSIRAYRGIRTAMGMAPREIDREIGEFRVLRRVSVGRTENEAWEGVERALSWESETAAAVHGAPRAPAGKTADGSEPKDTVAGGCIGTPEQVVEDLERLGALGLRHVIAWLNFGDLPFANVRRSMTLLAERVLPRMEESEPGLPAAPQDAVAG